MDSLSQCFLGGVKRTALYRHGMGQNNKLSLTHSFLELHSPYFAWKFVWTVQTNFGIFFKEQNGRQKSKWLPNLKIAQNSLIS